MIDQASVLRKKLKEQQKMTPLRTVAVISGKGGVGKSNFSLNFSIELVNRGHAVLLVDMDVGMGNIEILSGSAPDYTIADFFSENPVPLKDLITELPGGVHFIAGGTGLSKLPTVNKRSFYSFAEQFSALMNDYQYVVFDMAAGLNETSLRFILSVDEVIVITTPEPTSITDAYAVMKYITLENNAVPFYVIVNRSHNDKEGMDTFNRISKVLRHFLQKNVLLLGILPNDLHIEKAVKKQVPFIQLNAKAPSSRALSLLTERFCEKDFISFEHKQKEHIVTRLKDFLFKR